MNTNKADLNLLLIFQAMLEYRNVTRASESLELSQPAMSSALGRLRLLFDDPLFVRAGLEMKPTPRALELSVSIGQVVATIKNEILQPAMFDVHGSQRTFTLMTPDIGEANFLPRILSKVAGEAPGINLRTLAMPRHAAADSLSSGAAELAIGYYPDLQEGAGFFQKGLMRSTHVCVVRRKHPRIGASMTLTQFVQESHVVVRPDGREHVFEKFLQQKGMKRRVHLEVSHFISLLPIVETSDLVATVPKDLAEFFVAHGDLKMVNTPIKSPVIDVRLFWHKRFQKDPGHIWLRNLIHGLFSK